VLFRGTLILFGGQVHKFLLTIMLFLFTLGAFAQRNSQNEVVPRVKKSLITYVLRSGEAKEAYLKIKTIGLDAISFVQSSGKVSSKELDEVVMNVSRELEHEALFLNKEQIVASIISAINS